MRLWPGRSETCSTPDRQLTSNLVENRCQTHSSSIDTSATTAALIAPIALPPSSPFQTARELLDYAKANPGKLNNASQGIGSTSHLTTSWLQQVLGSELVHVPHAGTAPALNNLAAGHVDLMIADLGSVLPLAEGGKLRILAATTAEPVASIPNVPTLRSLGLEDFVSETWFAIASPEKTSAEVARKISAAVNKVVTSPEVKARASMQ